MKKQNKTIWIIVLLIAIAIGLMVIKREYLLEKYDWYRAEQRAEERHRELMDKYEKKESLSSGEIGELTAYFQLASKSDEGIRVLEEIKKRQDGYAVYFNLSGLYAYKARKINLPEEKQKLVSICYANILDGFKRVPDKVLAYFLRGKAFGVLGCTEAAIEDFNKAIEESKGANVIMLGDGLYVDRERFVSIVERDLPSYKEFRGDCLIESKK